MIAQCPDVRCPPAAISDDEVRVQGADACGADPESLESRRLDEPAGMIASRVAEHAPRVHVRQRLCRTALRLVLIDPSRDLCGITLRQQQRGRHNDLTRMLEAGLAVAESALLRGEHELSTTLRVPGLDAARPRLTADFPGRGDVRVVGRQRRVGLEVGAVALDVETERARRIVACGELDQRDAARRLGRDVRVQEGVALIDEIASSNGVLIFAR